MSVKIRLTRMGSKKKPFYRVVVVDSRVKRDGKYIEAVGTYNPVTQPMAINIKEDRVEEWLGQGAQPSETVKRLLGKINFWEKRELKAKGMDDAAIEQQLAGKEKKLEKPKKKKKEEESK